MSYDNTAGKAAFIHMPPIRETKRGKGNALRQRG